MGPEPRGPEVMRPVGVSGVMGLDVFLIGPEPELGRVMGPELGPDRTTDPELCWEAEDGREGLSDGGPSATGMSNILPSSPDFLTSPPV